MNSYSIIDSNNKKWTIFIDISPDDDDREVLEIENKDQGYYVKYLNENWNAFDEWYRIHTPLSALTDDVKQFCDRIVSIRSFI